MPNDFSEVMSTQTDAELLRIVNELRSEYQPDAVLAAENELEKRKLTGAQILVAKARIIEKELSENEKAKKQLPVVWKVLTAIFPGIIQFIIALVLKERGYEKMSKDLIFWTLIGIAITIGFVLTLKIFYELF
ncbi:MAG: hypothetical protein WCM76_16675 [Bacteroidota bacterium]